MSYPNGSCFTPKHGLPWYCDIYIKRNRYYFVDNKLCFIMMLTDFLMEGLNALSKVYELTDVTSPTKK